MNTLNLECKFETETYFSHIGRQLFDNLFADVNFDIFLREIFQPDKQICFKDIVYEDNLYIQSLTILSNRKLNYYLKTLEIIINEENHKVIGLKYDYFNKNEIILDTSIKVKSTKNNYKYSNI